MAKSDNQGKTALVTGASGGIGLEVARELAGEGFSLVLVARSRDKLEQLAQELKKDKGAKVTVLPADLNDPATPQAIFNTLKDKGIQIDLLVNNAGLLHEDRFAKIPLEKHMQLLQVNVVAMTAMTYLFLQPMLERNAGRILNVASIASFMPLPNLAVYAASKAYVRSFGDALAQELSGTKVTVTTLCPGVTETAMVEGTDLGSVPKIMIMDAKSVAREGVRACLAGKPVHVAGIANEIASQWMQYQPDWLRRAMGGFMARAK